MYLALSMGYLDIAEMLESKGATCTKSEIDDLGEEYTAFISSLRARAAVSNNGRQNHSTGPQSMACYYLSIYFVDDISCSVPQRVSQNPSNNQFYASGPHPTTFPVQLLYQGLSGFPPQGKRALCIFYFS